MSAIRRQYALSFAVMGSVLPYLSLFLQARGLSELQIGLVLGTQGVAVLLMPSLTSLLADTRLEARTILAGVFTVSAGAMAALLAARGFWPLFLANALYAVSFAAVMPAQDGLQFAAAAARRARGQIPASYQSVRVFGTAGFLLPTLPLLWVMSRGASVEAAMIAALVFNLIGLVNTLTLPRHRRTIIPAAEPGPDEPAAATDATHDRPAAATTTRRGSRLPTLDAARALLDPQPLAFCIGMLLLTLALSAYYGFYPIYLEQRVGVAREWVGPIIAVGVVVELGFMLTFGPLRRSLGFRGLMTLGALTMALRLALLAAFPVLAVALGTQLMHGMMVLTIHVAPAVYLDTLAKDRYRHSIQGLFAMTVFGTGRVAGSVLAGWVSGMSLTLLFALAASLCLVAAGVFALFLRERTLTTQPLAAVA